jgi:hypothetical protein
MRHWYRDRTGVLVGGMSAVVGGAAVRVTQQGIGFQNLPQPFVGFRIRFPGAYIGNAGLAVTGGRAVATVQPTAANTSQ